MGMYRSCAVPQCESSSTKTPHKLFIHVPTNSKVNNVWFSLARRVPTKSSIYFCEDHFDLPNDMENYMKYHIMGSVSKVRMKPGCVPTKFECQTDRKRTCSAERPYFLKKQRKMLIEDNIKDLTKRSIPMIHVKIAGNFDQSSADNAAEATPAEPEMVIVKMEPMEGEDSLPLNETMIKREEAVTMMTEQTAPINKAFVVTEKTEPYRVEEKGIAKTGPVSMVEAVIKKEPIYMWDEATPVNQTVKEATIVKIEPVGVCEDAILNEYENWEAAIEHNIIMKEPVYEQPVVVKVETVRIKEEAGSVKEWAGSVKEGAVSMKEEAGSVTEGAGSVTEGAVSMNEEAGSVKEGAGSVKEEAWDIAARALYADHEVRGGVVLGPECVQRPSIAVRAAVNGAGSSAREPPTAVHSQLTEQKTYSCKTCQKVFIRSDGVQCHILPRIKPYSCDICLKAFAPLKSLKRHKRFHTTGKPYSCETCSKAFKSVFKETQTNTL